VAPTTPLSLLAQPALSCQKSVQSVSVDKGIRRPRESRRKSVRACRSRPLHEPALVNVRQEGKPESVATGCEPEPTDAGIGQFNAC
jgi:hypothetical protein